MSTEALDLFDTTLQDLGDLKAIVALIGDGYDKAKGQEEENLAAVFYMMEKGLIKAIENLHQFHELSRQATAEAPATA